MAQIINKFLPSITTCKCSVDNEILITSITYDILNNPENLFFIVDLVSWKAKENYESFSLDQ